MKMYRKLPISFDVSEIGILKIVGKSNDTADSFLFPYNFFLGDNDTAFLSGLFCLRNVFVSRFPSEYAYKRRTVLLFAGIW